MLTMRAVIMALTVALVASHRVNLVPVLAGTQTYVYKYEALLFSGLDQEGLARAGMKISSKVFISAVAEKTFLLKLSNLQLFEYSGIWPTDVFFPSKITSSLTTQLQIPIKFEYANGVVGKIFAPSEVPTIIINLQRGILNILQLNLKDTENIYEVQEAGVQGTCRTQYVISEDEKTNTIVVIKSKDLTHCHERIRKDVGLVYVENCIECQEKVKSLSGTAAYNYIMKPTPNGIQISEATVQELHRFTPQYEIGGATQMEVRQTLTFSGTKVTPIIPISAEYFARGSLQYEFSTEILWSAIQLMRVSNPQAQVIDALNHLATIKLGEVHGDVPLKFIELVQLMRYASLNDIEGIWSQFKTRPNFRKWILDAIPAAGTPVALRFIKKTFLAGQLSVPEFTPVLLAIVHMVTANLDTIKMYSDLVLSHKVQQIPAVSEVAMLGYGTMIARYCAGSPACPVELLKPIHDIAAEVTAKADVAAVTLILKVLANAGHPGSIKPMIKVLPVFKNSASKFPLKVQVDAILALKVIAKKEPIKVQEVVLQIFMNQDLHPELRMVSWIALFETKPGMGLVNTLAHALQKETSLQVTSFAYSHIKALAKSTSPDLASIAAACNVAIKILRPKLDKLSYRYSQALVFDGYQSSYMIGAAGSAFIINDAATILPRAVVAKARAYLAGAAADVLEVGVRTDGIQEALLKSPLLNEDRLPRMEQVLNALKAFKALPIKQPLGSIYVKLFGQEIAFANIDKAMIEQATQFAIGGYIPELAIKALKALQNGIAFQYAKPLLVAEIRHIFPSAAGVPMELSLYTAAVAAANLKAQAIVTPPVTETINVAHLMKKDVKLTAEVAPSIALKVFAVMGVNTGFIQASSLARGKIHTYLPLKVEAKFDISNANFKIQAFPVVFPVRVATARFNTFVASENIKEIESERIRPVVPDTVAVEHSQDTPGSLGSPGDVSSETVKAETPPPMEPEMRSNVPLNKSLCSTLSHIGIKACMEVMSCNAAFIKNTTLYNMIGQHGVHIMLARADGPAVEALEFEVQMGPRAAKKLLKKTNVTTETTKVRTILQKLREILEGDQRNNSTSSAWFFNPNRLLYPENINGHSLSSSSSSNSHMSKTRFLGETVPPLMAVISRVVRPDRMLLGYQLAVYLDKPSLRMQILMASIAEKDNWKMCVDGVLLNKHKAAAKITWGAGRQQYTATINVDAGHLGPSPVARLKVKCEKLPTIIIIYIKSLSEYISAAAHVTGLAISNAKNNARQIKVIVLAPTERTLDIIIKTPAMTLSKSGLDLPFALPFKSEAIYSTQGQDVMGIIWNLYTEAGSAKCSMVRNTLTTFNNRKFNYDIPSSCYQILVQDCTSEHKFMVLMKQDKVFQYKVKVPEQYLNVKVADIDVDLYHQDSAIKVKMDGIDVPISNLSYKHPTGSIQIATNGQGISLYAPDHGLQEVYYSSGQWKIYVVDWMRGQTCGLCGKADGEMKQEYHTPSGHLTESPTIFAHSWVLSAESCLNASHSRLNQSENLSSDYEKNKELTETEV